MLVRLTIETTHLDARGIHHEQGKTGALVREDILEGRNWKHLDSGQGPELGCMQKNILEDSVTGISLFQNKSKYNQKKRLVVVNH